MVNYQNGKIYKIINENNDIIYIGSTAEKHLSQRYTRHEYKAPNHKIILIENYPCNSKEELCKREQQIIEEYSNLLNERKAYSSQEQKQEYIKEYYNQNRSKILEQQVNIYYQNNKNKISEKAKVKVICEFCNCEIRKKALKRHQRTINCMKFQECLSLD